MEYKIVEYFSVFGQKLYFYPHIIIKPKLKNNMKKIFNSLFIMAAITAMVSTSSCTKVCDPGYEGDDCKTQMRAKVLTGGTTATYNVTANSCTSAGATWQSTITPASDVSALLLNNFGHLVCGSGSINLNATIDGSTITIPSQTVCTATISGSGTVTTTATSTVISVTYTYSVAGGASGSCSETWTKI